MARLLCSFQACLFLTEGYLAYRRPWPEGRGSAALSREGKLELTEGPRLEQPCPREFQKGAQVCRLCATSARRSVRGSPREVRERDAKVSLKLLLSLS